MSSILEALERARRERERLAGRPVPPEKTRPAAGRAVPHAADATPTAPLETVPSAFQAPTHPGDFAQQSPYAQSYMPPPQWVASGPPPVAAPALPSGGRHVVLIVSTAAIIVVGTLALVAIFLAFRLGEQRAAPIASTVRDSGHAAAVTPLAPVASTPPISNTEASAPVAVAPAPTPLSPPESSAQPPSAARHAVATPAAVAAPTPEEERTLTVNADEFEGIEIGGVMKDGERFFVLISGRERVVGDTVRGYEIVDITQRTVVLRRGPTTYNLRY